MSAQIELTTPRLRLRPLTTRDAETIAEYAGDIDVSSMTARIPHPFSITAAFHWIADLGAEEFVRAIVHDTTLVGVVAFAPHAENPAAAELGYWLGKRFWGQGFATEAAHAVCSHCFASGLQLLTSSHFIENTASRNVLQKLGFRETGTGRVWCDARLKVLDSITYDLTRRGLKRLPSR